MNRIFKSLFIMNIVLVLLSVAYTLFPGENLFWNGYGLLLVLTLTLNVVVSVIGTQSRKLDLSYLFISSIGLFMVMLLNTVASLNPTDDSSQSILSFIILISLPVVGAVMTYKASVHKVGYQRNISYSRRFKRNKRSKGSTILLVLIGIALLVGVLMAVVMLLNFEIGLLKVAVSQYSLFYSLIFLSLAGLFLKFAKSNSQSVIAYVVSGIGIALYVIFAIPFVSVPSLLNEAEEKYIDAFGNDWQAYDDNEATFKDIPVSIPDYFFGIPSDDYELTEDVLYYEGTEGVDEGLELRFDVYTPPADATDLPGEGSTLIRIHGGGWDTGGKGAQNFAQVNKYFASQGYVVFDVQYGLNNQDQFISFSDVPEEVSGEFSIDDMVRHLGLFTTHLAENHEEYGANIDSVFVSGGSAGGHLANALALGSTSGEYTDLIDERINVNGIIPFYPANDLAQYREIGGEDELVDPGLLVDEDSPPALVFQGDKDSLVEPQVAKNFRDAYLENNNTEIAIIWMPYGAHASDLYFPGFYSQSFLYYMERFMYEYR